MARGRQAWLITGALLLTLLTFSWPNDAADRDPATRGIAGLSGGLVAGPARPFDQQPYAGHGTWADVFDYLPQFQAAGTTPPITPDTLEAMADAGVRTLFLQAGFEGDPRTPDLLTDEELLARFLVRAHANGIDVVGWYLPRFADADADLRHLLAIARFEVGGHRFDGLAVDIEFTADVSDLQVRNERLLDISRRLSARTDGTLGAIVLPPVLTEVVSPAFWPDFPWIELADDYDVWLPMSYWTTRTADSGYRDGFTYNDESTRRLRNNLDDPEAVVHAIGGIGDETTPAAIDEFARSLLATDAVGGSIYDWATLDDTGRAAMTTAFSSGDGSRLTSP